MISILLSIALKSVIVAGGTLGLLALLKNRSAAERSWVAHVGLVALLLLAFAPLVLPNLAVETPAWMSPSAPVANAPQATTPAPAVPDAAPTSAASPMPADPVDSGWTISTAAAAGAIYALPAAILLIITFLALARLIALRARADVLVDGHWLSALARAQRRMGFKHGTALLTSDDLSSPISWGLMRPVILLNSRAVEAAGEAEAIIAHELAHVARLDWAKLLLARVATALFWFNPLVWMLAREAHQLREEAADDAVLGADIQDTDYAQLLVGVARHECSGLLLGAHGVAPSKSSLARRVARVLDGRSARGPGARSFTLGVLSGAMLVAAPLAALTLVPGGRSAVPAAPALAVAANGEPTAPYYPAADLPTDLPSIIADGVSTSVTTALAVAAVAHPHEADDPADALADARERREDALDAAQEARSAALEAAAEAREQAAHARAQAADGRRAARAARGQEALIEQAIELRALGVTSEYVNAMRAAAPQLRGLDASAFTGLKAVGVTPDYAREMAAALPRVTPGDLTQLRAVGVTGSYVRAMNEAGIRAGVDEYVEMRAVGVSPSYVKKLREAGYVFRGDVDKLVELYVLGVSPSQLRGLRNVPPRPPAPPTPLPNSRRPADPDDG
ncbi:M56 family metallopeptidase [Sphingomonas lutea]|uniref:M56 family metallopeptidase n=1 Tax=Sphingomonas lutea TaxID=1045317 RepID=A0A7G9SFM4_9SPHN|nr:M56 family metallopeptidase [Sphingomonas lutea]QNN66649.1 M56 family metallopeptidase [Sphingomonas lutea]